MEKRVSAISTGALLDMVSAVLQPHRDQTARAPTSTIERDASQRLHWPQGEIEPLALAASSNATDFETHLDRRYAIGDFTRFHDRDFVIAAYRGLFERRPDAAGLAHYVALLRTGTSKVEILGRLRYSNEGKRTAALVAHLPLRYGSALLMDLPVLGAILALVELLARGASTRRSIRRLEAHSASVATAHARMLDHFAAVNDRNLRLLDERVEVLRRR